MMLVKAERGNAVSHEVVWVERKAFNRAQEGQHPKRVSDREGRSTAPGARVYPPLPRILAVLGQL